MVYVFGIDVPIVEVLLILMALLATGLAMILFELKRLRQLLTMERNVLHEFENALQEFESEEGHEHNQKLQNYVESVLRKGASMEEVRSVLEKRGWDEDLINEVIETAKKHMPQQ